MVYITGNKGSTSARVVDTCPACAQGNIINFPYPLFIDYLIYNSIGALDMSPKGKLIN